MRRSDREVTDFNEILGIVARCDVCRLALNDGDYPYILPLNFGEAVEDGRLVLYFHGAEQGRKYSVIEADNRASFEMDCAHRLVADGVKKSCTMEYESVIGHGRIEPVRDDFKIEALKILMGHYHPEVFEFNTDTARFTAVMKLVVEDCTEKRRKTA